MKSPSPEKHWIIDRGALRGTSGSNAAFNFRGFATVWRRA
jgi:hypothetical protein